MSLSLPGPVWLIGCGNMAGAMLVAFQVWVVDALFASSSSTGPPSGSTG